jgi:hypothetical protein
MIKKFYDESNKRETFQTQYIALTLSGQKKTFSLLKDLPPHLSSSMARYNYGFHHRFTP